MKRILSTLSAITVFLAGCTSSKDAPALQFIDTAPALGLTRVLRSGSPEKLWILENVGTGCALLDTNGDGLLDVFLANAGTLEMREGRITLAPGPGPALYVQGPRGRFADRTRDAGLSSAAWQTGVAVGDIDNDGDADLYVACFGQSLLFRNRGEGNFEEVSGAMGIRGERFGTSAVFFDYDRDGFLDLYSTGYVRFDLRSPPNGGRPCVLGGVEVACGPGHCEPEPDRLWHNERGNQFTDVSEIMGIAPAVGSYGLGVAVGDLDGDGWPDIYVANDTTANFLWHNAEGKRFEDVAVWAGAALSESGQGQAGMGTDIADADGDGRLDIFVTNYTEEYNAFYRNIGDGAFEDRTHQAGLAKDSFLFLGWGVKLADLDLDGDLDLVAANGHVYPQAAQVNPAFTYAERCLFYSNLGGGRFVEEGLKLGTAAAAARPHRGLAVGDIDLDGDLDLVLTVLDGPPVLLENRGTSLGNWISMRLEGTRSNRDAIGARVTLTAADREQVREVTRGGSYFSAQDVRLHFGLGSARTVERVQIRWPGGLVEKLGPIAAGAQYRVVEGSGKAVREE